MDKGVLDKVRLTEEQMNAIADEFENDTFQHEDAPIFNGSHYQLVNNQNQSVTVVYETKDVRHLNDGTMHRFLQEA